MPNISVIVPVYKVEPYLCRCIDSILSQTFSDFELVLVDDGSPDRCGEICEKYAKKDPRIRVVHQENGGLSAARNTGIRTASCEWVCFIDSDDLIHPDMLHLLFEAVEKTGANMAVCDCVQAEEPPEAFFFAKECVPVVKNVTESFLLELFAEKKREYWTVVPVLVRAEIIKKHPFTEGRIFEDNAVSPSWLVTAKTVAFLASELYFYRINPNGIVHEAFSGKRLDFLWALEEQLRFYQACGYAQMQGAVAREYIRSALWFAKRIRTELNDPKLSRRVVRRAVRIAVNNKKVFSLSAGEKDKLLKAAHPLLFRIRKKIRNLFGSRIKKKDPGPSGK